MCRNSRTLFPRQEAAACLFSVLFQALDLQAACSRLMALCVQMSWFSTFVSSYSVVNGINILLLIMRFLKVEESIPAPLHRIQQITMNATHAAFIMSATLAG